MSDVLSDSCANCGGLLRRSARFCPYCGAGRAPAPLRCGVCGAEARAGAAFCGSCGVALEKTARAGGGLPASTGPIQRSNTGRATTESGPGSADAAAPRPQATSSGFDLADLDFRGGAQAAGIGLIPAAVFAVLVWVAGVLGRGQLSSTDQAQIPTGTVQSILATALWPINGFLGLDGTVTSDKADFSGTLGLAARPLLVVVVMIGLFAWQFNRSMSVSLPDSWSSAGKELVGVAAPAMAIVLVAAVLLSQWAIGIPGGDSDSDIDSLSVHFAAPFIPTVLWCFVIVAAGWLIALLCERPSAAMGLSHLRVRVAGPALAVAVVFGIAGVVVGLAAVIVGASQGLSLLALAAGLLGVIAFLPNLAMWALSLGSFGGAQASLGGTATGDPMESVQNKEWWNPAPIDASVLTGSVHVPGAQTVELPGYVWLLPVLALACLLVGSLYLALRRVDPAGRKSDLVPFVVGLVLSAIAGILWCGFSAFVDVSGVAQNGYGAAVPFSLALAGTISMVTLLTLITLPLAGALCWYLAQAAVARLAARTVTRWGDLARTYPWPVRG